MASQVDIYNLALSNIAAKAFVQSLTENSVEKQYCEANFIASLNTVLEDGDFGFASAYDTLALIRSSTDTVPPPTPWLYEYQYPSEAIKIREITRETDDDEEVPFKIALKDDSSGKTILSDKADARARYTKRITNIGLLTERVVEAVSWKLSTRIVIPLTQNLKLKQNAEQSYLNSLAQARASDLNEGVNRQHPTPSLIKSRS